MMVFEHIVIPKDGAEIALRRDFTLEVPDNPIIPFIEGDGIGTDISPVARRVVDAAVHAAYGGRRSIKWMEVCVGEKARLRYGVRTPCPDESLYALRRFRVSLKGPLETPVGGEQRSLNVVIRQALDLYACVRPVRYFDGVESPVKNAAAVNMIVFRENTEDIYAGIEYAAGSEHAQRLITYLQQSLGARGIRFPLTSGIGVKPVSKEGTERIVRKALHHALASGRRKITVVHKGNIMKHTEGAFRAWAYELARQEFSAMDVNDGQALSIRDPKTGREIVMNDVIADNFLQQILLAPEQFDVIVTLNLNGDYISDVLAAQVGGVGIVPGANIGDGIAVFEATHGTAPTLAGKDMANPSSLILSAEMLLRYIGWTEAADLILKGISEAIRAREVTMDLARPKNASRNGAAPVASVILGCASFGDTVIHRMEM